MRAKFLLPAVLLGLLALLLANPGMAQPVLLETSHRILDIENRPIDYHVQRLDNAEDVPLLIVIDGSGCAGVLRPGFNRLFRPEPDMPYSYARLVVDKGGIDPNSTDRDNCPEHYHQRRSVDRAVLDHLRVLQHLSGNADWWNGKVFIYGWSEGGDIGARLTAYYPGVSRAVLGAMGGGLTMAQHFEDYWDCAADRVDDRDACLADLHGMFEDTRRNPTWVTEQGDSNMLWRSRLWADLATLLRYGDTPILVIQGALDRDSTPVQSGRVLINRLVEYGRQSVVYCEVADMEHGFGSLDARRALAFERGLLDWLLTEEMPGGIDEVPLNQPLERNCDPDPPFEDVFPPRQS